MYLADKKAILQAGHMLSSFPNAFLAIHLCVFVLSFSPSICLCLFVAVAVVAVVIVVDFFSSFGFSLPENI